MNKTQLELYHRNSVASFNGSCPPCLPTPVDQTWEHLTAYKCGLVALNNNKNININIHIHMCIEIYALMYVNMYINASYAYVGW